MMIHTDRLILRAFREEDAGDLLEYLLPQSKLLYGYAPVFP